MKIYQKESIMNFVYADEKVETSKLEIRAGDIIQFTNPPW